MRDSIVKSSPLSSCGFYNRCGVSFFPFRPLNKGNVPVNDNFSPVAWCRKASFNYSELLVVIAIIAVLVAILLLRPAGPRGGPLLDL